MKLNIGFCVCREVKVRRFVLCLSGVATCGAIRETFEYRSTLVFDYVLICPDNFTDIPVYRCAELSTTTCFSGAVPS